jgi:hypothetical protein
VLCGTVPFKKVIHNAVYLTSQLALLCGIFPTQPYILYSLKLVGTQGSDMALLCGTPFPFGA